MRITVAAALCIMVALLVGCDSSLIPELPNAPCAFVWTTRSWPDQAEAIQRTLAAKGLRVRETSVSAFGESCITERGTERGFGAREVSVKVSIDVDRLDDTAELGTLLGDVLDAIDQRSFTGSIPLFLTFHTPDAAVECRLDANTALSIHRQGVDPGSLFQQVWTCPLPESSKLTPP